MGKWHHRKKNRQRQMRKITNWNYLAQNIKHLCLSRLKKNEAWKYKQGIKKYVLIKYKLKLLEKNEITEIKTPINGITD